MRAKQVEEMNRQAYDACFGFELEFDVQDKMHFLHGKFTCQGQSIPIMVLPPIDAPRCNCSATTAIEMPQFAKHHRDDCELEEVRIIAIWQGAGSVLGKQSRYRIIAEFYSSSWKICTE
ncbi:unnamed protein product [Heligmosomoides polygyrus]|uniref:ZP domain-containing protein n=1 Tax=Heligmosomoides polygyrus TaxID=6339 RepID=A0A183FU61_HELPZ|nr:unnamed protein product [Heligmosomoides polygyrus]